MVRARDLSPRPLHFTVRRPYHSTALLLLAFKFKSFHTRRKNAHAFLYQFLTRCELERSRIEERLEKKEKRFVFACHIKSSLATKQCTS